MTGARVDNNALMSREMCVAICVAEGFQFAAVQFGIHCFCDNKFGGDYDLVFVITQKKKA